MKSVRKSYWKYVSVSRGAITCCGVESQVAGSVWQWLVEPGEQVTAGQLLMVIETAAQK